MIAVVVGGLLCGCVFCLYGALGRVNRRLVVLEAAAAKARLGEAGARERHPSSGNVLVLSDRRSP